MFRNCVGTHAHPATTPSLHQVHIFFPEGASGWSGSTGACSARSPSNDADSDIFPSVEMLDGEHLKTMHADRQACSDYPEIEGYYFTLPNDLNKALPRVLTQGLLGPMDAWVQFR